MRLCLFSSYFSSGSLPPHVRYWVAELRRHFDRLVMLTNDDRGLDDESLAYLSGLGVELRFVRNEGYDFGMWQKAVSLVGGFQSFSEVALVNDSCVCFAPLDQFFSWARTSAAPAAAMVKSYEISPHLQSYFLVFSGPAIPVVEAHLRHLDVVSAAYDDVVLRGEIGLSAALLSAGVPLVARYDPGPAFPLNASFACCDRFLDEGMPMIKRKMLHYPLGVQVRYAIENHIGVQPDYYISKIFRLYPERKAEIDVLLRGQFVPSVRGEFQLLRRVLRYWLMIRFERLAACLGSSKKSSRERNP